MGATRLSFGFREHVRSDGACGFAEHPRLAAAGRAGSRVSEQMLSLKPRAALAPAVCQPTNDMQAETHVHLEALNFELQNSRGLRARPMTRADLPAAVAICGTAFNSFNESVGLPPEFPSQSVVEVLLAQAFTDGVDGFVVENAKGNVVGSNLLEHRDEVAAIGPITVEHTSAQNGGAGRLLMKAVMKAAAEKGKEHVRLLQVAANCKSFSLYLDLGFVSNGTCAEYEGFWTGAAAPAGFTCAALVAESVDACSALHHRVRGVQRRHEIASQVGAPHPACTVREAASGELVAYTTGSHLGGHAVATTPEALLVLVEWQSRAIQSAQAAGAPLAPAGLIVPHVHPDLMRSLARNGFRLKRQLTQMSYGPSLPSDTAHCSGIYLPSIMY